MAKYCTAYSCSNNEKDPALSFHRFPKDQALRNQWIVATKRQDFSPSYHARLCSKHFDKDSFEVGGLRKRLKKNAVPNLFDFPSHLQAPKLKRKKPVTEDKKKDGSPKRKRQKKSLQSETLTCADIKTENCLSCCALECSNTSDLWVMTVLPQDPGLRQQWVDKIARDDWTPDESSALCEVHFEDEMWEKDIGGEKLLKPDSVPTIFFHGGNQSSINEENSLFKLEVGGQSMEHDESIDIEEHSVFIKQEALDPDVEMFEEADEKPPIESDQFENVFETVYCNNESTIPHKVKKEVEEDEDVGKNPNWKCLVPECHEMLSSEEEMYTHVIQRHKNTEEVLKLEKNKSLKTKPLKEMREMLKASMTPSIPTSGIILRPVIPAVPGSSSFQTNVDKSVNDPSAPKKFVLLVPQKSRNTILKAQNTKPLVSLAPLPPPQPSSSSMWPPVDDSEIFSISLARFSKEKRIAIKKKIIEFVDAVHKRDLDPDQIIMALCNKG